MKQLPSKFRQRSATAAVWQSSGIVLYEGEFGIEIDTGRYKIGNGVSPWNNLPYCDNSYIECTNFTFDKDGAVYNESLGTTTSVSVTVSFNAPVRYFILYDATSNKDISTINNWTYEPCTFQALLTPGHTYGIKVAQWSKKNAAGRAEYVLHTLQIQKYFQKYDEITYPTANGDVRVYLDPSVTKQYLFKGVNVNKTTPLAFPLKEIYKNARLYVNGIQGGFSQAQNTYTQKCYYSAYNSCGEIDILMVLE